MDLAEWGSGEVLGGVRGGETVIRIYRMKKYIVNKMKYDSQKILNLLTILLIFSIHIIFSLG